MHITVRRPADRVATTSSFAGEYGDSYSNMLVTEPGCGSVEVYVQTPQGDGPVARTRCG